MKWVFLLCSSLLFGDLLLEKIDIAGLESEQEASNLKTRLSSFLGQPLTLSLLGEVKEEILNYYRILGNSLVTVHIPDQNATCGEIQIEVRKAKVGEISFQGNHWIKTCEIKRYFDFETGDEIEEQALMDEVAWFNRNPFRSSQAVLSPGSKRGASNIEFVVQDRFPLRFFTGADNTGTSFGDTARLYAGFNWGNALAVHDLFTYQFTFAPSLHRFRSHTLSYNSFLPWKHQLNVYGGYAVIHPKISGFKSSGENFQASLRYEIPFRPFSNPFQQEIAFGADYKNLNSNLFFISTFNEIDVAAGTSTLVKFHIPMATNSVDIFQFYGNYAFHWTVGRHDWTLKTELFASPIRFLPNQTKKEYRSLRPGSYPYYAYLRTAFGDLFSYSRWFSLSWLLRGQASTGALVSSEQFGLGGYDTVRGYKERSFNGDFALCGNLELQSGRFTIFPKNRIDAYALAFFDLAKGWNWHPINAGQKTQNLAGVGAGIRINWLPYILGRLDYGFQLNAIPGDSALGRAHMSLSASY